MENKHYYQIINIERKNKNAEDLKAILNYEGDNLVSWCFTTDELAIRKYAHEQTLMGTDYLPADEIGREMYTSLSLEQLITLADVCFCEVLNCNDTYGIIAKGTRHALNQLQMLLDYSEVVRDGTYKMYEVAEGYNLEVDVTADAEELTMALQALAMLIPDSIQVNRVSSLCYKIHILANNITAQHQDMLDALGFSED